MTIILDSWERSFGALFSVRATYLFYYMALGCFLPFITLYYERLGLSGVQIGALAAIPLLVGALTSLFWSAVSDAFRLHKIILNLALLLAPLAVLALSKAAEFSSLVFVIAAYAVFSSPISPLLDSRALEVVRIHGRTFGELRVYGSIGWSVSTLLVGVLVEKFFIQTIFYSYAILMFLTLGLSMFQPKQWSTSMPAFGQGLRKLIRPHILIFLSSILLLAMITSAINAFLSIYLDRIGTPESLIGLAWALASLSEVPVMMLSGAVMRRIGASGLLMIAFATYALRTLLFSFIHIPLWALSLQLIHGLSFTAFLVGGVTYMNQKAPRELSTTAQAIFNAFSFGIGSMLGVMMGGYLYDTVGLDNLFRFLSLLALVGLAVFWLGSRMQPLEIESGMERMR